MVLLSQSMRVPNQATALCNHNSPSIRQRPSQLFRPSPNLLQQWTCTPTILISLPDSPLSRVTTPNFHNATHSPLPSPPTPPTPLPPRPQQTLLSQCPLLPPMSLFQSRTSSKTTQTRSSLLSRSPDLPPSSSLTRSPHYSVLLAQILQERATQATFRVQSTPLSSSA